jgi:hypothetical protein
MVTLAARHPVINIDDHFLVTNGFTEAEEFESPMWVPNKKLVEPSPITMSWNRKEYVVEPGATLQVPFDAMRLKFGDPRAMVGQVQRFPGPDGRNGIIPTREAEVIRLSIAWGLYQQGAHLLPFYPHIRHVKITTIPMGDTPAMVLWTPANDPKGTQAMYGHPEVEPNRADFLAIMESMEAKQARQDRELEILRQAVATGKQPDDIVLEEEEPESKPKDVPTFS